MPVRECVPIGPSISIFIFGVAFLAACGGGGAGTVAAGKGGSSNSGGAGKSSKPKIDGGTSSDASSGGQPSDGGSPIMGAEDSGAPVEGAPDVEILEPAPAADPNADPIITTNMATVRCKVTKSQVPGARDVNQSTVRILLANPKDANMPTVGTLTALADNTFEAKFNLSELPNGALHFSCDAADVGSPPITGSAAVDSFLDLGPSIDVIEPKPGSNHALGTPVLIKFQITPDPVSSDDMQATPTEIALDVSGQAFDFTEDSSQPGLFTANVPFNDKTLFPMAPTSSDITVSAASSRMPDAPTRVHKVHINLDSDGPTIVINKPGDLQIVRGEVGLELNITDASGVDPSTVFATINSSFTLMPSDWTANGSTYTAQFDTLAFGTDLTEITINVSASDVVGNQNTVSLVLRLDNRPPIMSLDPPPIREYNQSGVCSDPFDPVGADATNDGDTVLDASLYRLLIWDETNHVPGETYSYIAGVEPTTVKLFVQQPSKPFLIDTDGDGVCDDIAKWNDNKGPDAPVHVDLVGLNIRGMSFYDHAADFSDPANLAPDCMLNPGTPVPPMPLCPVTPMTRIVAGPSDDAPKAVYAFGQPTNSNLGPCAGEGWDVYGAMGNTEGWLCLAARAEDKIGNVGISPPLRVCVTHGTDAPTCNPSTDTWPTCTDNCTPPPNIARDQQLLAR